MKAIVYYKYGSPEVLQLEEIEKPAIEDSHVLIRVRAAAVNPYDWHFMRGSPWLMRLMAGLFKPKNNRVGIDVAGVVEAVGKDVTRFRTGDEVYGNAGGAFAEYTRARETTIAHKPANMTFEQAAAVPTGAVTALQALRDHARIQAGQAVLINGASGGVGIFAVQIAKAFGADVTGVCSTRNVEMVRSLGADHIVDYTKENFTQGDRKYDIMIDNIGNHSLSACRCVLTANGHYVGIGGDGSSDGIVGSLLRLFVYNLFVSQKMGLMIAKPSTADFEFLKDQIEAGKVRSVIDRQYTLAEVPEAIRYIEGRHARGKVVITIDD